MEFTIETKLPASPDDVFDAWLNSDQHSAMTGSPAQVSSEVGGRFTSWDNYISGTNLEIDRKTRILQAWRTTDFKQKAADSLVEIIFQKSGDGCIVTIHHSHLGNDGGKYKKGWEDYYFDPMERYFLSL